MLPTGYRTFHFVSFLYVFFFSFLFLLFRFFSHYFVFVFLRFVFFVSFRYFSPCFLFVFFLSVSFRFFSFFPFLSLQVPRLHYQSFLVQEKFSCTRKLKARLHYQSFLVQENLVKVFDANFDSVNGQRKL